jgi:hypothetical protein
MQRARDDARSQCKSRHACVRAHACAQVGLHDNMRLMAEEELGGNEENEILVARAYILLAAFLCGTNFSAVKLLQETFEPARCCISHTL